MASSERSSLENFDGMKKDLSEGIPNPLHKLALKGKSTRAHLKDMHERFSVEGVREFISSAIKGLEAKENIEKRKAYREYLLATLGNILSYEDFIRDSLGNPALITGEHMDSLRKMAKESKSKETRVYAEEVLDLLEGNYFEGTRIRIR